MTNNGADKIGNLGTIVYDSGTDTPTGKKRIGTSATEIELLDDIPPSAGTGRTISGNNASDRTRASDTQIPSASINKQNNYQTLSHNREQSNSNVVYQSGNDKQLHSAVDKLLDKYAPDATPQNLLNTTTSRQPPSQVTFGTSRDESSFSTFQANAPPSSAASHNYSTINRPKTGQIPLTQTQINTNYNSQPYQRSQPATAYDSFQHVIPPSQQQPPTTAPTKTKNENFSQVEPGKLYTLDDDPLHLFFDKQKISTAPRQQPTFNTTFQPSSNYQTTQDPSTVIYTNTSQGYSQPPRSITTDPTLIDLKGFDLGNLIKRVQEDYLREIQPYVSSAKFVEKDQEYGQSLADIGFTTPVSVRKGFTRQADDILRRSAGRTNQQQKQENRHDHKDYYEEDDPIDDLHSSNRRQPLKKFDSKQSFTSVSSVTTYDSDYEDNQYALNKEHKAEVRHQGTSPPPKQNQTKIQSGIQNPGAASIINPIQSVKRNESDDEQETSKGSPSAVRKPATRIPSDQYSTGSSGSATSYDEEDYPAKYNEHEHQNQPNPRESVDAVVRLAPNVNPLNSPNRGRINVENQKAKRSEDIHPTPPTINSTQPAPASQINPRAAVKSESEESGSILSGSDLEDESDVEDEPSKNPTGQTSNTSRTNTPVTTGQNSTTTARTTTDTNARDAVASGTTPNIHFAPPDQRGAPATTNERGAPATTNPPAPVRGAPVTTNPPAPVRGAPVTTNPPAPVRGAPATTNPPAPVRGAPATTNPPAPVRGAPVTTNPSAPVRSAPATTNEQGASATTNSSAPVRGAPAASTNPSAAAGGRDGPAPPTTTSAPGQSGSTRLFKSDADSKFSARRSIKDAPSTIGNKIKSIFHRK